MRRLEFFRPIFQALRVAPCVALCVVLSAASPALAQSPQGDESGRRHGIFIDTVDVSLVNVGVVALDRDGKPVDDLKADDFEVRDDGEIVEITHFSQISQGRRITGNDGDAVPGPTAETNIVVLVDEPFIAWQSRQRLLKKVAAELDALVAGGSRVLVAVKDRQVEIVQPFTTDREALAAALDKVAKSAANDRLARSTASLLRQIGNGLDPADDSDHIDPARSDARATMGAIRSLAQEQSAEVRRSIEILRLLVNGLAGLPGRKAVLHLCDRLPLRSAELEWNVWWEKYGEAYRIPFSLTTAEDEIRKNDNRSSISTLVADASASRVAFYPLGAGLNALAATSMASSRNSVVGTAFSGVDSRGAGLEWLATATGGASAVGGGTAEGLLRRLGRDLGSYYSLAYPSPHRGDGGSHKIRIRVNRPGVELRYANSYRDKGADDEIRDRTLTALQFGVADNPLDARVDVGEVTRLDDGNYRVGITVSFPMTNILLLPQEENHAGDVVMTIQVRDVQGGLSEAVQVPVPLEIPNTEILNALSQRGAYKATLTMAPGEQTIAVGIRDRLGAKSATVLQTIDPGNV